MSLYYVRAFRLLRELIEKATMDSERRSWRYRGAA